MKSMVEFTSSKFEVEQRYVIWGNGLEPNKVLPLSISIAVTFDEIILLDYCLKSEKNGGPLFTDALNQFVRSNQFGIPTSETAVYIWSGSIVRELEFRGSLERDRFVFDGTITRVWKWECA